MDNFNPRNYQGVPLPDLAQILFMQGLAVEGHVAGRVESLTVFREDGSQLGLRVKHMSVTDYSKEGEPSMTTLFIPI
jgi:hypothetical protein